MNAPKNVIMRRYSIATVFNVHLIALYTFIVRLGVSFIEFRKLFYIAVSQ